MASALWPGGTRAAIVGTAGQELEAVCLRANRSVRKTGEHSRADQRDLPRVSDRIFRLDQNRTRVPRDHQRVPQASPVDCPRSVIGVQVPCVRISESSTRTLPPVSATINPSAPGARWVTVELRIVSVPGPTRRAVAVWSDGSTRWTPSRVKFPC